jgi:hypothetical protein
MVVIAVGSIEDPGKANTELPATLHRLAAPCKPSPDRAECESALHMGSRS